MDLSRFCWTLVPKCFLNLSLPLHHPSARPLIIKDPPGKSPVSVIAGLFPWQPTKNEIVSLACSTLQCVSLCTVCSPVAHAHIHTTHTCSPPGLSSALWTHDSFLHRVLCPHGPPLLAPSYQSDLTQPKGSSFFRED